MHFGRESVVYLGAQRGVAVESLGALQEPYPFRQQRTDRLVAAVDIGFVDALRAEQGPEYVAQQGFAAQQAQVLALDALAVQTDGYECYGFHRLLY